MQAEFLLACLKGCRQLGIHTALDTSGFSPNSIFSRILPYVDLFLFDIKQMDREKHKRFTGVDNKLILRNLTTILQAGKPVWLRVPLAPGYTDAKENITQIADLAKIHDNIRKISLLPYNQAAGAKYLSVGRTYPLDGLEPCSREKLATLSKLLTSRGINTETCQ